MGLLSPPPCKECSGAKQRSQHDIKLHDVKLQVARSPPKERDDGLSGTPSAAFGTARRPFATALRFATQSNTRRPADGARHERPVVRVVVGRAAVAGLDEEHPGVPVRLYPADHLVARRRVGRQQYVDAGIDVKVTIRLVEQIEILQAPRDGMIRVGQVDRNRHPFLPAGGARAARRSP